MARAEMRLGFMVFSDAGGVCVLECIMYCTGNAGGLNTLFGGYLRRGAGDMAD